jgi:hypothetical protein
VSLLLLCFYASFSQEVVSKIPLELKRNRDVFQIVNDSAKTVILFLSDKETVNAFRLNEQMQKTDSLFTVRPLTKMYDFMIDNVTNGSKTILFWSSSNHKDICAQTFDFDTHKTTIQNYSIAFKGEKILQHFSENGKFYIMSIVRDSAILKLYIFNNGTLLEKELDMSSFKFQKANLQMVNLYEALEDNFMPFEGSFGFQKINSENPISLTESAKKRKLYLKNNKVFLTFDNGIANTFVVNIDLNDFSTSEKIIQKPYVYYDLLSDVTSNSFLIDDKLYQINSSVNKMAITVKDLNNNLIKEYEATDNQFIAFKNSEILQENGSVSNKRILEKSSQFLRKITNSNMGISCYKINDNYLVTTGAVSEQQQNNSVMFGAMFGVAGVLLASAISNPTMESFNSYANRKVVYIHSLFDKNANHVLGEIQPLAFDKIRTFFDKYAAVSSQTLFKLKNIYYLGYYDNNEAEYSIRRFQD